MEYKKRISNEEIIQMIQRGDGNRDDLLEMLWLENKKLVRKIIHRITGLGYNSRDFEDLEQQAFIGIMEAVQRYDGRKGVKFFSFANSYIAKSIYAYYDKAGQSVRIPPAMRRRIKDYEAEKERMREAGEPATDEAVKERLQFTEKAFDYLVTAVQRSKIQQLDGYLDDTDKEAGTLADMMASDDDTEAEALKGFYDADLHILLMDAIKILSDTERHIIIARHYQGMNNIKISKMMGCTKQNVSRIANTAYKAIRTGKHREELLEFLPEGAGRRARKRIVHDLEEITEEERGMLVE